MSENDVLLNLAYHARDRAVNLHAELLRLNASVPSDAVEQDHAIFLDSLIKTLTTKGDHVRLHHSKSPEFLVYKGLIEEVLIQKVEEPIAQFYKIRKIETENRIFHGFYEALLKKLEDSKALFASDVKLDYIELHRLNLDIAQEAATTFLLRDEIVYVNARRVADNELPFGVPFLTLTNFGRVETLVESVHSMARKLI